MSWKYILGMKENLRQDTNLLSESDFKKLEVALNNAWSVETTYPDIVDAWSVDNAAYGHCATTALLVQELYGGVILYDKSKYHLWNELSDGAQIDLTRTQFQEPVDITIYKRKTREEVLNDENGIRTNIATRYAMIREAVFMELGIES